MHPCRASISDRPSPRRAANCGAFQGAPVAAPCAVSALARTTLRSHVAGRTIRWRAIKRPKALPGRQRYSGRRRRADRGPGCRMSLIGLDLSLVSVYDAYNII